MKRRFALFLTAMLVLVSCDMGDGYNSDYQTYRAVIKTVIDGQTLTVRFSDGKPENSGEWENIRLLGVGAESILLFGRSVLFIRTAVPPHPSFGKVAHFFTVAYRSDCLRRKKLRTRAS